MNMNDVLYMNNPPYVNMNLYHRRRNSLTKSNIERLLGQLRRYRNEYRLAGSRVVSNTIKNLENSLIRAAISGSRQVTRENLLKARSRLRLVPKQNYRKAPFSASNLQKAKAKLRPTYTRSPQKLANLALRKLVRTGRGANVPWHMVPKGSLRRALSKPKITQANVRVGKTNLNIVKNFKSYMNLVKNAQEYASGINTNSNSNSNSNINVNRIFRNALNAYRNRYGLTPEQDQRLYVTVLKIARFPKPGMSRTLVKMREKYLKKGFLNAKDVGFIMKKIKGGA